MLLPILITSPLMLALSSGSFAAISLTLEGDPGTRIEGYCEVVTEHGKERHPLGWVLPQKHEWQASSITCLVEQISGAGSTTAILEKNGNRSRLSTSGPGSRIRLKMD